MKLRHSSLALLVLTSLASLACHANDADCGMISIFESGSVTIDLFPADIDAINGENQTHRTEFPVRAGTYELKVYERIYSPDVMVSPRRRGFSKKLVVDVQAGKRYEVGAQFNRDKKTNPKEFWDPVVWKVGDLKAPCKAMSISPKS